MSASTRFFFYGTLIAGSGNATAREIHLRLRPLGPARVTGALWAIAEDGGWYPALVAGAGAVQGELYAASPEFSDEDLGGIDRWEDFQPECPRDSLYVRRTETVTLASGQRLRAEVYRYNRPLPQRAEPIPDGDFAVWLAGRDYHASAHSSVWKSVYDPLQTLTSLIEAWRSRD